MKRYESIAANAKLYFGSSIPSFFINSGAPAPPAPVPLAVATAIGEGLMKGV